MPESVSPGLMDPAIIVAQPAGNSGRQFISQRYDNQPHIAAQMQQLQTQQQQQQQPKQMVNSMIDPQSNTNQQSRKPQQILQDYNSQTYAQVAVGPAAPSAVPQASVPLAGETQLPTSAADVSNKSVASRDFGQSGAGDYQEMAAFQGHPPGNSYRPDSYQATYNNYNKSGFSGGPYQKRGGMNSVGGPESGVDPSGGTVGNTSRGGMRGGGITRGGSSDSRGASRGGFTRPLTT
uniref:Uncharacterized protein n=1 Tax=Arion vulgaris TaxID=1028688 RepID=A0A0B7BGD5_9EUPU